MELKAWVPGYITCLMDVRSARIPPPSLISFQLSLPALCLVHVQALCQVFASSVHGLAVWFHFCSTYALFSVVLDGENQIILRCGKCEGRHMKRGKLIRARIKKGLSQKVAAELLGVSRNTWSLWELGKKDPYPVYVEKLCTFFYIKEPSDLNLEPPQLRTEQAQKRTSSHTPPQSLHTQTSYYDYSQQFLPQDSREQAAVPSLFPRTSDIIEAGENSKEPEGAAMDEGRRQLMRDAIGVTTTAMIAPASLFEQFARVLAKPSTIEKYHLSVLEQRTA